MQLCGFFTLEVKTEEDIQRVLDGGQLALSLDVSIFRTCATCGTVFGLMMLE
jgi:hypothetical protein